MSRSLSPPAVAEEKSFFPSIDIKSILAQFSTFKEKREKFLIPIPTELSTLKKSRYLVIETTLTRAQEQLTNSQHREAEESLTAVLQALPSLLHCTFDKGPSYENHYHSLLLIQTHCLRGIVAFNTNQWLLLAAVAAYLNLKSVYQEEDITIFYQASIQKLIIDGNCLSGEDQNYIDQVSYGDIPNPYAIPANIRHIQECLILMLSALKNTALKARGLMQALFFKDSFLGAIFNRHGGWFNSSNFRQQLIAELINILSDEKNILETTYILRFQQACETDTNLIEQLEKEDSRLCDLLRQKNIILTAKKPAFFANLFKLNGGPSSQAKAGAKGPTSSPEIELLTVNVVADAQL